MKLAQQQRTAIMCPLCQVKFILILKLGNISDKVDILSAYVQRIIFSTTHGLN